MVFPILKISEKNLKAFYLCFAQSIREDFVEYNQRTRTFIVEKEFPLQKIRVGLADKVFYILAAFEKKKVVGYAFGSNWNGGVATIYWLGVVNGYKGKGIGRELIERYETDMKNLGIHNLELRSPERNIRFYQKLGFTLVGKIEKTFFGTDDWLLYKILQKPKEENYLLKPVNQSI